VLSWWDYGVTLCASRVEFSMTEYFLLWIPRSFAIIYSVRSETSLTIHHVIIAHRYWSGYQINALANRTTYVDNNTRSVCASFNFHYFQISSIRNKYLFDRYRFDTFSFLCFSRLCLLYSRR
jgi:hypothetical protein